MDLESRAIKMKVIKKREITNGLIFKRPTYLVALQIIDEEATTNPTMQREFPFHQYNAMNVDDEVEITMYTPNGHTWYYSRREAELFGK